MTNLKINTAAVVTAATNINTHNEKIRDGISSVEKAIRNLDESWESPAATVAIAKFNEIKSTFAENRFKVLKNYTNFLLQQVSQGYDDTEDVNVSLAAQFK